MKYKLSLILILLAFQINAQDKNIDSLKLLLSETTNDTTRLDLIVKIAERYKNYDTDSAWFYIRKGQLANSLINASKHKASYFLTIATLYNIEMKNDSAIYYALKALDISRKYNYPAVTAYAYLKLGLIYFTLTNFNKALEFYQKAKQAFKKLDDSYFYAICSSNIANIYLKKGDLDSSMICYNKSLEAYRLINAKPEIANTYSNIGIIWFYRGDYKKAVAYYKKSLAIDTLQHNNKSTAISYTNIGEAQIHLKQYTRSETNLQKAYATAKKIKAKNVELSCLEYLSELYKAKKDYKTALAFHEKYKDLNDSLFNNKRNLQIIEMQEKFNVKEQEHQNSLLLADNQLKNEELKRINIKKTSLSVLVFMALLIIGILLRNRTKLKSFNQKISNQNKIISDQNEELQHYQLMLEEQIDEKTNLLETALIKSTESERLKSEFLENISHEIRTPMNAIQGFSELLETNHQDRNYTNIIQDNIDQLLNLMDNLLELSKFKAGQYKLNITNFSLPEMFKQLEKQTLETKNILKKSKIKLNFVCNKSIPEKFSTDKQKVFKIYQEIINNALKYTEEGSITINCKHVKNKLSLTITDTGIGIKEEKLPYVFEAFNRINIEEKRYRGTGIGLAIVNSSVSALNGSITVDSKKNKGSSFTITIPNLNNKT